RRRSRHQEDKSLVLDLNNPKHVNRLKALGIFAALFACLSAIGGYRSYHFTESTEFCGLTCHKVMEPEFVTYHSSPHAKVSCVECHIGSGADWYVKSKMSGLRQVYAYLTNSYELPIDTPIHNLRPARETCEECHWPEKFSGNLEKTITHYTSEEDNHPYAVRLVLKVGGGSGEFASGIHWHVSSGFKIEYISTDRKRLEIPWVKMTAPDGKETVFTSEEFDPEILNSTHEIRTMDCIDCHNRPSHIFKDPLKLVNESIGEGKIDVKIPEIKYNVMGLLEEFYATTEEAHEKIEETLTATYLDDPEIEGATFEESVKNAIAEVKEIYSSTFFPEKHVDWTTHPDFNGHFRWDGCYRCHDGTHTADSGEVITHDCNNCHLISGQAEGFEEVANMEYELQKFYHPMDMGELEPEDKCTDCHEAPEPTDYVEVAKGE
ncbi:MAG: NapC/NirT family cytochrome c, partial [Candidatus Omnitrophica bacterium]|nr:NapC/NirT family cytochrome c [Candidatus Omnitrophota bacterium]